MYVIITSPYQIIIDNLQTHMMKLYRAYRVQYLYNPSTPQSPGLAPSGPLVCVSNCWCMWVKDGLQSVLHMAHHLCLWDLLEDSTYKLHEVPCSVLV